MTAHYYFSWAVFYCQYLKKMVTYDSYDFSALLSKEILFI